VALMARRIEVELIANSRSLERGFARSERAAKKFEGTMLATQRRLSRAGGIGSMFGISGPTAAAGGAFLLGRQFVKAARDAEVILGQTSIAVKDAGLSWQRYSKDVEAASKRISDSSAFDDEAVLQSFQVFVRGQKDVEKSLRLTELAADVARGRYIELDQATQLVNKAAMGQIGALRRAGIQIDKNATSAQALDALLKAYSGSAQTYADSATGSSEKLAVAWENLSEVAGGPLSQSLAVLAQELTIVVGLMEKASKITLPGFAGGGSIGGASTKSAMTLIPGVGPLIALGKMFGFGGGGGGPKIPGGSGMGGVGSIADSIIAALTGTANATKAASAMRTANTTMDQLVAFIGKYSNMGAKFGAAQDRFAANQKKAQARRDAMQLRQQRVLAGRENTLGWLDFGLEKAESTKGNRDNLRVLRKREQVLKSWIATEGRTLNLVRELWRTRDQIRELNKRKSDKDPLAGLMQVSSKRLAQVLAAGTGIGRGGMGRLEANIAGQEIHNYVILDGRQVAHSVNTHQTRGSARTARQTSGFRG
jgi:hypothetical protein